MRILKIFTGIILGLFVLIGVAIFAVTNIIDPNDFKNDIEKAALEQAGLDLSIAGDIRWSFFPTLALQTGELAFAFEGQSQLAQVQSASFALQVAPLLSKSIAVNELLIDGLRVNLVKDAQGHVNWLPPAAPASEDPKIDDKTHQSQGFDLTSLEITAIRIENAELNYTDAQQDTRTSISDLNFTTGAIRLNEPVDINLDFNLSNQQGPETRINSRMALSGRIDYSQPWRIESLNVQIDENTLQGDLLIDVNSRSVNAKLTGNRWNLNPYLNQTSSSSRPANNTPQAPTNQTGPLVQLSEETLFTAELLALLESLQLDIELALAGIQTEMISVDKTQLKLTANQGLIELHSLETEVFDGVLQLSTSLDSQAASPSVIADIKAANINMQELLSDLTGLDTLSGAINLHTTLNTQGHSLQAFYDNLRGSIRLDSPLIESQGQKLTTLIANVDINQALKTTINFDAEMFAQAQKLFDTRISLSTDIDISEQLHFNNVNLAVDSNRLMGTLRFNPSTQFIAAKLQGNDWDINRYIPPSSNSTSEETASEDNDTNEPFSWSTEDILPTESLQNLNLDITLDLDSLRVDKHAIENIGITLLAQNGLIELKRLESQLYGGQVSANGSMNTQTPQPITQANLTVNQLNIGQALSNLSGSSPLRGSFSTQSRFHVQGASLDSMVRTLKGDAKLRMNEGVIEGIDLVQNLCQGLQSIPALVKTGSLPANTRVETAFTNLFSNLVFEQGIINNDVTDIQMDSLEVSSSGRVDLVQLALDMRLGVLVKDDLFQQTCRVNNRLQGLEIPVRCRGQFNTPPAQMCLPDMNIISDLALRAAQQKLEERIGGTVEEVVQEKAEEKLESLLEDNIKSDTAKEILRGLFR